MVTYGGVMYEMCPRAPLWTLGGQWLGCHGGLAEAGSGWTETMRILLLASSSRLM